MNAIKNSIRVPKLIVLLSRMGLNKAKVLIAFTTLACISARMSPEHDTKVPKYLNLETHSTTSPLKAMVGRGGALPSAHTHMNLVLGMLMVNPHYCISTSIYYRAATTWFANFAINIMSSA
jgi:hypothetical protein